MKKKFLFLILFFKLAFSQDIPLNLLIDDTMSLEKGDVPILGVYDFRLAVPDKSNNIDYYSFIINCDSSKSFEENGIEFTADDSKLITLDDLKKISFCEVHDLFSKKPMVYLVKKDSKTKKLIRWIALYNGTIRNVKISREKTKI